MASSLISNSLHISFDSVLGMDDAGLLAVFEYFVATGLKGFLGFPSIYYEDALTKFFENGLVRDGMIVSTIQGISVEISEEVFAATFELPMEGLTDLSEVPKDLVFDAGSIFPESKEQLSISCKKKEMKIEFRLLGDILAKTIYVKAGSFDAVTHERFLLMTAITYGVKINWINLVFDILKDMVTPGSRQAKGYAIQICVLLKNVLGLELGESRAFPSSRILTEKTVHRYVVINEKVGGEEVADAPRVKKTPVKKAASKKRPAIDAAAEPVVKNKRTKKSKSVSAKETLEILPVAQEAVPLQMIAPTPDDKDVEIVCVDEPVYLLAVADVLNEGISTADDVDIIIEQVIAETAQIQTDEGDKDVDTSDVGEKTVEKADELEQWLNLSYEEFHAQQAGQPVVTSSDTDEDMEIVEEMETEAVELSADEAMSLEDILMTIPVECPLEITQITLGTTISILGVLEGD
ncbi:hypothetical protein F511_41806 [Dorcoceras hygrometricum]|uniref:Dystroglycan-like n=1 Tax=Dorcoceras hygrometricum TaxID=472368 RepID=A0A2Z7CAG0_9LAMI|nr:hypothetical protein F511_41806 [Dorcoceras hygrometricum]